MIVRVPTATSMRGVAGSGGEAVCVVLAVAGIPARAWNLSGIGVGGCSIDWTRTSVTGLPEYACRWLGCSRLVFGFVSIPEFSGDA